MNTLQWLRNPDAELRRTTLAELSPVQISEVAESVLALLEDPDWRVRREASSALARASDASKVVGPLCDAVENGDVSRRNAAIEALRQRGTSVGAAVLERLAAAPPGARRFLVEVLGDTGDAAAVPVLVALLSDRDGNLPHAAAESLGRIAAPEASAALRAALSHEDPVVRLASLQALSDRSETLHWSDLRRLVSDPLTRRAALKAAAQCPEADGIHAVVSALSDRNASLSAEAAVACAATARGPRREVVQRALKEHPGAARVLRALAAEGSTARARSAAVQCLGMLADPGSVACVLRASEQAETSSAAAEALEQFGTDAVLPALEAAEGLTDSSRQLLLRWGLTNARPEHHPALLALAWQQLELGAGSVAVWDVLASLGDATIAERLVARLEAAGATLIDPGDFARPLVTLVARHPSLGERLSRVAPTTSLLGLTLAEILAAAGHPVDAAPLREALTLPEPRLRAAAVRALAATGREGARDALAFALADEDSRVQAAAAEALSRSGSASDVLEQSLRASSPKVRQAAVRAAALRGGDLGSLLASNLQDPDAGVVLATMDALGERLDTARLRVLCQHEEPDVVAEALARLRALDPAGAQGMGLELLAHPAWSVRLEAVRSLNPAVPEQLEALRVRKSHERDELVSEALDRVLGGEEPAR